MKSSKFLFIIIAALLSGACSKDDPATDEPVDETPKEGVFVLAAKSGIVGADYLLTANSLDEGTVSIAGDGIEQNGQDRTYLVKDNLIFSFLFRGDAAGAVTAYKVNASKKLEKVTDFQTETLQTYGEVKDGILMVKNAWQPEEEYNQWYRFDTKKLEIVKQGEINAEVLAGKQKNEKAFFTDIKQVGDKVFAPFWSVESGITFKTSHPDSNYIAVYNYPEMTLDKVIRDGRTGSIGMYYRSGLDVDEQDDIYALGTKLGPDMDDKYSTKTPVAFMKIKKGTTEYDQSYFFDITEASGGKYVFQKLYLGKGNFLLTMADRADKYGTTWGLLNPITFAIANVYDKSFKWVTGATEPTAILRTTEYSFNYSPLDGKTGYLGINTSDSPGIIFKFDAETATATPGLTSVDGGFTSVNWVPVSE